MLARPLKKPNANVTAGSEILCDCIRAAAMAVF
jgi:hypothetical protein